MKNYENCHSGSSEKFRLSNMLAKSLETTIFEILRYLKLQIPTACGLNIL